MDYLLDTHAFIWLDLSPEKLSDDVKDIITDEENKLFLSLVSVWEIQIKMQLGKIALSSGLKETIQSQQSTNSIQILPVRLNHILAVDSLPFHHRDPFDRLLIAQAQVENLILITNDSKIQPYNVKKLW